MVCNWLGRIAPRRASRRTCFIRNNKTCRDLGVAARFCDAHVLFGGWRVGDVQLVRVDRAATRVAAHMYNNKARRDARRGTHSRCACYMVSVERCVRVPSSVLKLTRGKAAACPLVSFERCMRDARAGASRNQRGKLKQRTSLARRARARVAQTPLLCCVCCHDVCFSIYEENCNFQESTF